MCWLLIIFCLLLNLSLCNMARGNILSFIYYQRTHFEFDIKIKNKQFACKAIGLDKNRNYTTKASTNFRIFPNEKTIVFRIAFLVERPYTVKVPHAKIAIFFVPKIILCMLNFLLENCRLWEELCRVELILQFTYADQETREILCKKIHSYNH